MSDFKLLLFGVLGLAGLAYSLWQTQLDWHRDGFGLSVVWGTVASLSAFIFVAFLFASSVLKGL